MLNIKLTIVLAMIEIVEAICQEILKALEKIIFKAKKIQTEANIKFLNCRIRTLFQFYFLKLSFHFASHNGFFS